MNDQVLSGSEQQRETRPQPRYKPIFIELMIVAISMVVLVAALYSTTITY